MNENERIIAGKYRTRRVIGRGGFGAVYEAEHLETGRRVAIKTMGKRHAADDDVAAYEREEEAIARFRREARATAKVDSPYVVHVFDVGEEEESGLYLVMELLVGEDLAKKIDRAGCIEPAMAARWAYEAALGLSHAHVAGVVHRDLKPANLFLANRDGDEHPVVKIVDFGVSKLFGDSREKDAITRAGMTMGTPQYMAPEQVRGGTIDHRVDVWSLGAVLYEMLSGVPAYPLLPSPEQTFLTIATSKPKPLGKLAPHVPKALVAVVEAAMEHEVEDRIPDAKTFADRIVAAMPGVFPEIARPAAQKSTPKSTRELATRTPVAVVEPASKKKGGNALVAIVVVAVLAGGAALAWTTLSKRDEPPPPPVSSGPAPKPPASATETTSAVEPSPSVVPASSTAPSVASPPSTTAPKPTFAPRPTTATPTTTSTQLGGAGVSSTY